ncbi:hypothetical protein [Streptomyces carpinensis]|uniref:Uncharacterized protein n=1 Tax=Streptomyces carpinensis TaxID=66369 RepID=A0ABV1W8T5_9ACTN|nr:hypothetical protein [Streptomyces carpinensis]
MGTIRDVTGLAAAYVLARLLDEPATGVVTHQHDVCLRAEDDTFTRRPLTAREHRPHVPFPAAVAPFEAGTKATGPSCHRSAHGAARG